jgi:hypothetical protein
LTKVKWKGPRESVKESMVDSVIAEGWRTVAVGCFMAFGLYKLLKDKWALKPRHRRPSDYQYSRL